MKVAIIEAGNVGKALGTSLARAGHQVTLAANSPETARVGLRPLDVGPLRSARHLEGMAFVNIGLNSANGWDWTSAWELER